MAELMFRILKQDDNDSVTHANQQRRSRGGEIGQDYTHQPIAMMEDDKDKQIKDNTPMLWRSELGQASSSAPSESHGQRPDGSIFNKDMQFGSTPLRVSPEPQAAEIMPGLVSEEKFQQPISLQDYMLTMPEAPTDGTVHTPVEVFGKPGDIPEDTPQHEPSPITASGSSVRVPGRHSGLAGAEGKVEMMILNHDDADVPETIMITKHEQPRRSTSKSGSGTGAEIAPKRKSTGLSDTGRMRSFKQNQVFNYDNTKKATDDVNIAADDLADDGLDRYGIATSQNGDTAPLIKRKASTQKRTTFAPDVEGKGPVRRTSSMQLIAAGAMNATEKFKKGVRKVINTQKMIGSPEKRLKTHFDLAKMQSMNGGNRTNYFLKLKMLWANLDYKRTAQAVDRALPIVNPNSGYRRYWDFMILAFVIYNAVAVPLDAGFPVEKASWIGTMENCIDAIFALDIFYNFRTAYVDEQGNMVRDSNKIAKNYFKAWFTIDVLASIPFESVAFMLGINVSEQVTLLAFLKTPRLLRLGRLLRFFERMKNANIFRIVRLMATMCLISHWIACIWHFLYIQIQNVPWIFDSEDFQGPQAPSQFLVAFYSSFVLMMGDNVNPQNNWEYIFCCIVLVVGACFMATVVGNMALLVSNMNVTAARHRTKMDMITDAVRYLGMPDQIQERVQEYFDYLSQFSHPGPDGMNTLGELPTSLYEDICALLHVRIIRTVPPFKNCEEPFIMQLVTRLTPAVYMPGDTIFRGGDVGHEMYLISKGKVAVINNNDEMVAILKEGTYFGELALLATARRVATCASLTHCDLNVLNSADLQMTMRDFPMSSAQVKQWAMSRLSDLNPSAVKEPPPDPTPPQAPTPPTAAQTGQPPPSNVGPQPTPPAKESAITFALPPSSNMGDVVGLLLNKLTAMESKLSSVQEHISHNDGKGGILGGAMASHLGHASGILDDHATQPDAGASLRGSASLSSLMRTKSVSKNIGSSRLNTLGNENETGPM